MLCRNLGCPRLKMMTRRLTFWPHALDSYWPFNDHDFSLPLPLVDTQTTGLTFDWMLNGSNLFMFSYLMIFGVLLSAKTDNTHGKEERPEIRREQVRPMPPAMFFSLITPFSLLADPGIRHAHLVMWPHLSATRFLQNQIQGPDECKGTCHTRLNTAILCCSVGLLVLRPHPLFS